MNPTLLALGLGALTGWSLHTLDGAITSGTCNFKPQRFEGGGMRLHAIQLVAARLLHQFLEGGRNHSSWIKGCIEEFEKDVDYLLHKTVGQRGEMA